MSCGPGRIERELQRIFFNVRLDNAFTTEELAERLYPGVTIEKKHRVAIIRAAERLRARPGPALRRAVAPTLLRGVLHVQAQTCAHHQGAVCIQDPFEGGRQRSAHGASEFEAGAGARTAVRSDLAYRWRSRLD